MQYQKALILAAAVLAAPMVASAAPYFQDSLEDPSTSVNYNVNAVTANSPVVFGFDYSGLGIPLAPGAATTHALELRSNVNSAAAAVQGVTVATKNFVTNTSYYKISAYVWINSPGPWPGGGTGSTQFFDLGAGSNGTTTNWRGGTATGGGSGVWFAADGEGGFSSTSTTIRDYSTVRGSGAVAANFVTDPTAYPGGNAAAPATAQDNANSYYATNFPGLDATQVNGGLLKTDQDAVSAAGTQSGTTANGSQAFAWHLWTVERNNSLITWSIDGHEISELTSTPTTPLTLDGAVALSDFDATSGVTGFPNLNFALVSGLTVTPEPTSLVTLSMLGLGLLSRRRRA